MDLSRPFYDSNIEALRVNADGTHDKVRLGELRVGDVVMTADARGGVRASRVTNAQTIRQPTKWFVADVAGYEQLNPTGTTGTYRTLADGIAVGVHSHLLNAHPEPVTRVLGEGSKSVGALDVIGGKRAMLVNGSGCVDALSLKFFVCAGLTETRDYDKIATYQRALRRMCQPLGPGYKIRPMRHGRRQLLMQFGDNDPISIPIAPHSSVELNGIPVRVQRHDGSWKYLKTLADVDDALANFAREHGAAASWRTAGALDAELATALERAHAPSVDEVLTSPEWERKCFRKHVVHDRLGHTAHGTSVAHAFMIAPMEHEAEDDDKGNALDIVAWVSGFWFGDGFARGSDFSVGLPEEGAQGVPTVEEMPTYISERKFDADEQTWEFVKIMRRLALFCDTRDAELVLLIDERRTQAKQCVQVGLRRRGAYEGVKSIMREVFKDYGMESKSSPATTTTPPAPRFRESG